MRKQDYNPGAHVDNKIKFGIISGAGPMAGALLYQRVIEKLQANGAWRDADFPEILTLNVPFSEMLLGDIDNNVVREELLAALRFVSQHVDYVYIACQTLHAFITEDDIQQFKIISLLKLTKQALMNSEEIWVVASKTSRVADLHSRQLQIKCHYIEPEESERVIEAILRGKLSHLTWLEALAIDRHILLGCTEFSVLAQHSQARFINPIELAANDIVAKCSGSNLDN